ncbi:response regulator [Mesobacillus stamsii]|uniref:Ca2+-binding EF-hand superfamily protein n=1 Tax=Mesobacillus stamsii TaxID=225347 RepID=A0ABU0FYJ8_9BACI|nr:response regulator [Mesobacillus stamsii]MDQ0415010.1 Ca2+-binding EF-hand superfamily protein [Mesobacillus stamsii]
MSSTFTFTENDQNKNGTFTLFDHDGTGNLFIRELVAIYLKKEGYTVLEANDGVEAVNILSECTIHLCIIDVMMPNKVKEVPEKHREGFKLTKGTKYVCSLHNVSYVLGLTPRNCGLDNSA